MTSLLVSARLVLTVFQHVGTSLLIFWNIHVDENTTLLAAAANVGLMSINQVELNRIEFISLTK